jgi:clathrin heavy chain
MAANPLIAVAKNYMNDGILAITKTGSLHAGIVEEGTLLNYLLNNCRHIANIQQLAYNLACRYNLSGVDGMFTHQFNNFLVQGDYANAAKIASMSPGTLLRNQ